MEEKAFEVLKKLKGVGIVLSIIVIILGICMFVKPIATGSMMIWILVVGVLINGIEKIVSYVKMPKESRDGFLLAVGILWTFISVVIIFRGLNFSYLVTANIEACIGIMIGFTCMFSGIGQICGAEKIKQQGGSKSMAILGGVMEILCALVVLSAPLLGMIAITIMYGVYLIMMGVALLVRCLAIK